MEKRQGKRGQWFPITTIDWSWLVDGYNKMYDTDFQDEQELYLKLLPSLSPRKLSLLLGVCVESIYRRLDYYGIERRHKQGGSNHTQAYKREAFLLIPESKMAEMTIAEIMKKTGISSGYCSQLLRSYKRSCIRRG